MEGQEAMQPTAAMEPLRVYKASAGSGKTFTLAVEYISLLAMNPLEYQHILAVTFTNKATAEMKQRILSTLYGIAHGLKGAEPYVDQILHNLSLRRQSDRWQEEPYRSALASMNREVLRRRAKEALTSIIHDYSRFHVETIDAFFQSIVRELANELELSTKLKVELDESEVLSEAVSQIIDNLREGSSEFRTIIEFIEEKIRENRSWQVEDTVKEFGRNIFKENYLLHGEEVRRRITDFNAIRHYRSVIGTYLEEKQQQVQAMGQAMLKAYELCNLGKDGTKSIVTFMEKVRDYQITEPSGKSRGTFSDAIWAFTIDAGKWLAKTSKRRDELMPEVESRLIPLLEEAFRRHDDYVSHLHTVNAIGQHLYSLMLLNQLGRTVKELNEEAGRFLLSETANFLRNMIQGQDIPFIYEKTGALIKHIMIDEFQDTSALQWDNFKPLILNSLATDGSCLIVGDVKQSIYRFRNSDWQILNNLECDPDLRGTIGHIPAEYNFRSSRQVVDFNNELFTRAIQLLQKTCPALSSAYGDVKQKPKKSQEAGYVRVESMPEELMLQQLQLSVKDLIDNGVKANDITILVRTNREVPLISEYFNTHQDVLNVKIVSDDAFRLDASPAVNILIDALRTLAEPSSQLHQAALTHHVGPLPAAFDETARQQLCHIPLAELVEALYPIFQLDRLPHQDAYLFYFYDLVEQFCQENQSDLDSFLKAWDEELSSKTIPSPAADGVRIMTMHKSKGLEFHSVVIPSCTWSIAPKATEVMWCTPHVTPYDQMPLLPISVSKAKDDSIFASDRRDEELRTLVDNINVLYVAFTRAKNNLIILTGKPEEEEEETTQEKAEKENTSANAERTDTEQIDTAQALLLNAMPAWMAQRKLADGIMVYERGVPMPSPSESAKTKEKEKEENVLDTHPKPKPVTFVPRPSVAEFRQSYESDLFITQSAPSPGAQQHAERIRLISLGNLYHSIFQLIRTPDDVPHAIRQLQSKGCFGTLLDAREAQETIVRMLADIAPQHPEWFSAEWKVLNERAILFLERQMLTTKRPDRVVVNGQQAIIIDYKTAQGVVKQRADGSLLAPSENRQQVEGYRKLLKQMGYTDVKAYLWYILDRLVVEVA